MVVGDFCQIFVLLLCVSVLRPPCVCFVVFFFTKRKYLTVDNYSGRGQPLWYWFKLSAVSVLSVASLPSAKYLNSAPCFRYLLQYLDSAAAKYIFVQIILKGLHFNCKIFRKFRYWNLIVSVGFVTLSWFVKIFSLNGFSKIRRKAHFISYTLPVFPLTNTKIQQEFIQKRHLSCGQN